MNCQHCGTEIAANALICFRCGRATAEPGATAGRRKRGVRGGGLVMTAAAALLLMIVALYMGRATFSQVPRELSWSVAGLAAIVLAWRLWKRGRS